MLSVVGAVRILSVLQSQAGSRRWPAVTAGCGRRAVCAESPQRTCLQIVSPVGQQAHPERMFQEIQARKTLYRLFQRILGNCILPLLPHYNGYKSIIRLVKIQGKKNLIMPLHGKGLLITL